MRVNSEVLIVEDDADWADSLQDVLYEEGLTSLRFASAEETLKDAPFHRVGCAILDLQLPAMSGLNLLAELRGRGCSFPILVVTGQATVTSTIQAFENGVSRFFQKPVELLELLPALHQAIANGRRQRVDDTHPDYRLHSLTPREREVLELLLQDKPTKRIARELSISSSTVEKHRAKILSKFGVSSVLGLANLCRATGNAAPMSPVPMPHLSLRAGVDSTIP